MEGRFAVRMEEMLAQAEVDPAMLNGMLARLEKFVRPFAATLGQAEQRRHAHEYVSGLLSKVKRKSGEAIAYLHDQDRQTIQKFLGQVPWDHAPMLDLLTQQVSEELGEADGVLVFDPSAYPKKGTKSVGVARQWCGRLGKVENCQVGIYMAYVSRKEHALVDVRLYLPKEWTKDRKRCREAGVPKHIKFRTRHELALEMLDQKGSRLPHSWIAGDDEMGRSSSFRRELRDRNERYLLAVPSNTLVRDLEAKPPVYSGRGRYPKTKFQRVDRWREAVPETAWTTIDVRDGEKGPLLIDAVCRRVQARAGKQTAGPEEMLVGTRERQADGSYKYDYYLSNATPDTPLVDFARAIKAEHRVEECLQRGKSHAGLAEYQVRNWIGWHHHQTLSFLAAWFLNRETRGGKNQDAGTQSFTIARNDCGPAGRTPPLQCSPRPQPSRYPLVATQRAGAALSLSLT